MREELSLDYNISINNMLEFTSDEVALAGEYGYKLSTEEFYSMKDNTYVKILLLRSDDLRKQFSDQIFKMNDGKFILEFCPDEDQAGGIVYYVSEDLKDLF